MKSVIRISTLFIIGLSACSHAQISQYAQPGGRVTAHPSHTLQPNDFQDVQDAFTDKPGYVEVRGGLFSVYAITGPVQQQYDFITLTNQKYRIIKSSAQLGYIDTDNTYKLLLSTLPVNARLWKMSLRNECYLGTDQIGDRWQFQPGETTKLLISTYIPCGKYALVAGDKGFMFNISTPMANDRQISVGGDESIVLYSQIGDLRDWGYVNGGTAQWLAVNRNDGETLTGGFVQSGNLCVTKKHLLGTLVGVWNDDTTDGERFIPLNTNIGAVSQDSIVTLNGMTYFTSSDGEIEFNGTSYRIISDDVQGDIEDIAANSGATTGETQAIYTTAADWGAGTCTKIDTTTISGSFTTTFTATADIIAGFGGYSLGIDVNGSSQTFWNTAKIHTSSVSIYFGGFYIVPAPLTDIAEVGIKTLAGVIISSTSFAPSGVNGKDSYVTFNLPSRLTLSANVTYYIYTINQSNMEYAIGESTGNTFANGKAFNGTSVDWAFKIHSSPIYETFGQWTSGIKSIPNFIQWGTLGANFTPTETGNTNTAIKWYVSVATGSALCTTSSLIQVTTGYNINSSSGNYVLIVASMTTSDIGVSPKIDDITLTYTDSGLDSETTLISYPDELNNRLYISGVSDGSTKNDVVHVWQGRIQKWTKLNLNARSFLKFNNKVYIGDSSEGPAANIWEYSEDYTTDNGTAIEPMIHTPDYIPSGRNKDSKYKSLWVYTDPSTVYPNLTLEYYINNSETAYKTVTLSQAAVTGYENMTIKHKVPSDLEFARFRYISFRFTDFTRLYGFDFNYESRPEGER